MQQPTIIVQARMSSSRLPGKMLLDVAGKPMLAYVVERLQRVPNTEGVIVATSNDETDDAIIEACVALNYAYFRGGLNDVSGRFLALIKKNNLSSFVRICGDSPMIDPAVVERAVRVFLCGDFDLVSNVNHRSYPKGESVEVVRSVSFEAAMENVKDQYDREHVTSIFYRDTDGFAIDEIAMSPNMSHVQLSVDTQQDFDVFKKIVALMKRPHWDYGIDELIEMHAQITSQKSMK